MDILLLKEKGEQLNEENRRLQFELKQREAIVGVLESRIVELEGVVRAQFREMEKSSVHVEGGGLAAALESVETISSVVTFHRIESDATDSGNVVPIECVETIAVGDVHRKEVSILDLDVHNGASLQADMDDDEEDDVDDNIEIILYGDGSIKKRAVTANMVDNVKFPVNRSTLKLFMEFYVEHCVVS